MIDLNQKKYEVPTLEFGTGDIRINAGFMDEIDSNIGAVTFKSQEPHVIGRGDTFCNPMPDEGVELQFLFTKVESIDALIDMLNACKQNMLDFEGE